MRRKGTARTVLAIAVAGCLVSAEQARCESVFDARAARPAERIALSPALPSAGVSGGFGMAFPSAGDSDGFRMGLRAAMAADTLETIEVEGEEAKGHSRYKELAAVLILAAVATYAAVTLLRPDDEETTQKKSGGKEVPDRGAGFSVRVPLIR